MKTRIMLFIFAAITLAFASLAFSSKNDNNVGNKASKENKAKKFANYYYEFTGSPGQEENESLWSLISEDDYLESPCNKDKNGCVIKTISSATAAPAHPDSVPVTGTGPSMTPNVDGTYIADAKFKNPL